METKSAPYYAKKNQELLERTPGVSITGLADAIGKDRNTIRNYLTGATSVKLDDLTLIAEYFKVPVSYFLEPSEAITKDSASEVTGYSQLLTEKDKRIEELKEQLEFLKEFYKQFSAGK